MSNIKTNQTIPKTPSTDKRFRVAWVVEPSHDMSPLLKYVERIEFLCSGYERTEELMLIIADKMTMFNRETDVLVPTGRVIASLITGIILTGMEPPITLGLFRERDYHFSSFDYGSLGKLSDD